MAAQCTSLLCLLVLSTVSLLTRTAAQNVVNIDPNQICDNGKFGVEEDLGPDSNWKCGSESFFKQSYMKPSPAPTCNTSTHFNPTFKCMDTPLSYSEHPPLEGDYRPVAPQYGEYQYLPPQRWLHALRLGAVAFLYHPCTPTEQVSALREVARSCLWKHLLTPYPHLSSDQPLALVSWGCVYRMEWVEPRLVREWLEQNALRTDESADTSVGAYSEGLVVESDSNLPPHTVCSAEHTSSPTTTTKSDTPASPCSNVNSSHTDNDSTTTNSCPPPHPTNRTLDSSHERLTVLMALAIVILLLAILLVFWRLYVSCSFGRRDKGKYKYVSKYFPVSVGRGGEGMVIPEMGIPKDGFSEREKLLDESDEDEL